MSQIAVLAKIPVQPDKRDEVIAAMQAQLDSVTENEQGTIYYILHTDPKDDGSIVFYELYADQAAFDAHGKTESMKAMGPLIAPFMTGRPELKFFTPLKGKG